MRKIIHIFCKKQSRRNDDFIAYIKICNNKDQIPNPTFQSQHTKKESPPPFGSAEEACAYAAQCKQLTICLLNNLTEKIQAGHRKETDKTDAMQFHFKRTLIDYALVAEVKAIGAIKVLTKKPSTKRAAFP